MRGGCTCLPSLVNAFRLLRGIFLGWKDVPVVSRILPKTPLSKKKTRNDFQVPLRYHGRSTRGCATTRAGVPSVGLYHGIQRES